MSDDTQKVITLLKLLRAGDQTVAPQLLDIYADQTTSEKVRQRMRDAVFLEESIRNGFSALLSAPQPEEPPKPGCWNIRAWLKWATERPYTVEYRIRTPEIYERELLLLSLEDGWIGPYDVMDLLGKLHHAAETYGIDYQLIDTRIAAISSPAFRYALLPDSSPYVPYLNPWERTPLDD